MFPLPYHMICITVLSHFYYKSPMIMARYDGNLFLSRWLERWHSSQYVPIPTRTETSVKEMKRIENGQNSGHWWICPREDQSCEAFMFTLLSADLRRHGVQVTLLWWSKTTIWLSVSMHLIVLHWQYRMMSDFTNTVCWYDMRSYLPHFIRSNNFSTPHILTSTATPFELVHELIHSCIS